MTILFLILAAICFALSATRRIAKSVPWTDVGLILLAVALIFWVAAPGVDLD